MRITMKWLMPILGALALWVANRILFRLMDDSRLVFHFGIPTLFLLLCMGVVGWVGRNKKKFRLLPWVLTWASMGFSVAGIVASIAWMVGASLPYNNFDLLWPLSFGLAALKDTSSVPVGLLLVTAMGVINALYYALLAATSWTLLKTLEFWGRNSGDEGRHA